MKTKLILLFLFLFLFFLFNTYSIHGQVYFENIGSYETNLFDQSATEIIAYDKINHLVFSTNAVNQSIDIIDISDPRKPFKSNVIDLSPYGHHANSVDYKNGVLVVAVEAANAQKKGKVVFFESSGYFLKEIEVGFMPDMLSYSHNGCFVAVACEGEPSKDYSVDPKGSVVLIDITNGVEKITADNLHFIYFTENKCVNSKSIISHENLGHSSFSQDLEPEYVSFDSQDKKLYVCLQENNAIAKIDVKKFKLESITGLGFKDIGSPKNGMDVSDKDKRINIKPWKGLYAFYQPDAIKCITIKGEDYIITANEGETRHNNAFNNVSRVKNLKLDPKLLNSLPQLKSKENLGRLKVDNKMGDTDGDGDYDELYTFGARSFSIWNAKNLAQIYDSGADFEKILAESELKAHFNSNNDDQNSFDKRSDDKGCEPEGILTFILNNHNYVLIGLDRMGGFMCYDITNPQNPIFQNYTSDRNFTETATNASGLGPEGLLYVPIEESPINMPLVLISNEVSGQITIFRVKVF